MKTTKLFKIGRSQDACLPKEFRMSGSEVLIRKEGDTLVLDSLDVTSNATWDSLFASLSEFPDDFMTNGREPLEMQKKRNHVAI